MTWVSILKCFLILDILSFILIIIINIIITITSMLPSCGQKLLLQTPQILISTCLRSYRFLRSRFVSRCEVVTQMHHGHSVSKSLFKYLLCFASECAQTVAQSWKCHKH